MLHISKIYLGWLRGFFIETRYDHVQRMRSAHFYTVTRQHYFWILSFVWKEYLIISDLPPLQSLFASLCNDKPISGNLKVKFTAKFWGRRGAKWKLQSVLLLVPALLFWFFRAVNHNCKVFREINQKQFQWACSAIYEVCERDRRTLSQTRRKQRWRESSLNRDQLKYAVRILSIEIGLLLFLSGEWNNLYWDTSHRLVH